MSLIERDLAIRAIAEDMHDLVMTERPNCNDTVESWIPISADILSGVPDAEPEIIRCKDCKHRGEAPNADGMYWCEIHDTFMYYCSDAERREDEQ